MKIDDKELKKILQDDTVKMDDDQKKRLDQFLEHLPEKEVVIEKEPVFGRNTRKRYGWKAAFAMLAVFVILPNVNPTVAYAMYEIPLLGKLFEVVTVREYEYADETHEAEIKTPKIIVEEAEAESVDKLNEESQRLVDQIIEEFEKNLEEESYQGLYVDYEVLCDTEDWFTLKLSVSEVTVSSDQYFKFYHIDKVTGQSVQLSDLFITDEYIEAISEEICRQMNAQMNASEDDTISYWTESEYEDVKACYVIDADQNFYFNEAGELVIVYDKYVVGPGSMGCPEFRVPQEIYGEYLK